MLSDKIITTKSFDAAGTSGGSHNRGDSNRKNFGSNYWGDSTLRSWLNSNASAGKVTWLSGNAPTSANMWKGALAYAQESGFLTNFSTNEQSIIKNVTQKAVLANVDKSLNKNGNALLTYSTPISTCLQNYTTAYSEQITDTVFCLDIRQIYNIYNNLSGYHYSKITNEAYSKLYNTGFSHTNFVANGYWLYWLRTPIANSTYQSYVVNFSNNEVVAPNANYSAAGGVRPAFFLDESPIYFISPADNASFGNGSFSAVPNETADQAYRLTFQDSTRNDFEITDKTKITTYPGRTISLPYSNAITGTNEYISAMIEDTNGDIIYYGRVYKPSTASANIVK